MVDGRWSLENDPPTIYQQPSTRSGDRDLRLAGTGIGDAGEIALPAEIEGALVEIDAGEDRPAGEVVARGFGAVLELDIEFVVRRIFPRQTQPLPRQRAGPARIALVGDN